jgi:hypothetical protein
MIVSKAPCPSSLTVTAIDLEMRVKFALDKRAGTAIPVAQNRYR